jgi:hypothetical protein
MTPTGWPMFKTNILLISILLILTCSISQARDKFWKSSQVWGYLTSEDLSRTVLTKTANYNMAADDYMILADGSSNTVDIKVPNPALVIGREYVIKASKTDYLVRVIPFGSELFDEAENISFTINNSSVTIISIGAKWLLK